MRFSNLVSRSTLSLFTLLSLLSAAPSMALNRVGAPQNEGYLKECPDAKEDNDYTCKKYQDLEQKKIDQKKAQDEANKDAIAAERKHIDEITKEVTAECKDQVSDWIEEFHFYDAMMKQAQSDLPAKRTALHGMYSQIEDASKKLDKNTITLGPKESVTSLSDLQNILDKKLSLSKVNALQKEPIADANQRYSDGFKAFLQNAEKSKASPYSFTYSEVRVNDADEVFVISHILTVNPKKKKDYKDLAGCKTYWSNRVKGTWGKDPEGCSREMSVLPGYQNYINYDVSGEDMKNYPKVFGKSCDSHIEDLAMSCAAEQFEEAIQESITFIQMGKINRKADTTIESITIDLPKYRDLVNDMEKTTEMDPDTLDGYVTEQMKNLPEECIQKAAVDSTKTEPTPEQPKTDQKPAVTDDANVKPALEQGNEPKKDEKPADGQSLNDGEEAKKKAEDILTK